jgi:hypothetical protein
MVVILKEQPRERLSFTSSFIEISTDQLGNRVVVRGETLFCLPPPLYGRLVDKYLKTT